MLFVGLHVKRMKELSDLAVFVLQQNIAFRVKSGKFGLQVNSDKHLQTV